MPMVLLNCRTALVSSLVAKRKTTILLCNGVRPLVGFLYTEAQTRVVVWRTSIPFTALLGKYKKTFKMSGQCTTLSKCQNKEIIELPVGLAVLPQRSRRASCASWLTVIILYPKNCMWLYFQVVGRYRHQIQRVLLPDLYQTLQESR